MTSASQALPQVLEKIDADIGKSIDRLFDLVRIPSISTDSAYKDFCKSAADFVAKDLASLGFEAVVRPTAGHPVVVGKSNGATAANNGPSVLFYGHYDVQPVDPLNLWSTPPFEPRIDTLPDGRKIIVGRGACDDKGQFMTFVEALRAFKAVTGKLPLDITMMIEGEEECGSKSLFDFVRNNAAEFKRDLGLVCDTGMWSPTVPSVTTSLRGLLYEEVTITCADRDLHSGVFGGGAANPIRVLARIIAALHDENGRITIPGFYDGVKGLPDDIEPTIGNLAERLGLRHHSTVELVDRLEQRGLIYRERSDRHRSFVFVRISPRGESILRKLVASRKQELQKAGPILVKALNTLTKKAKK